MIRAVIFDVGGPLDMETAFEAAIDTGIRNALAAEGYVIDDDAYHEAERWAVESFAPNLYRAVIWRLTSGDEARAARRRRSRRHDGQPCRRGAAFGRLLDRPPPTGG